MKKISLLSMFLVLAGIHGQILLNQEESGDLRLSSSKPTGYLSGHKKRTWDVKKNYPKLALQLANHLPVATDHQQDFISRLGDLEMQEATNRKEIEQSANVVREVGAQIHLSNINKQLATQALALASQLNKLESDDTDEDDFNDVSALDSDDTDEDELPALESDDDTPPALGDVLENTGDGDSSSDNAAKKQKDDAEFKRKMYFQYP